MDLPTLLALALWSFTVAVAGGVAGLVLGNLRLPLVVALASSPAAGAGANVAVSGVGALTASVAHARAGRLDSRLFWWMAPPSLVGAIIGGLISGALAGRALLAVIGVVVLYGGVEVLRHRRRRDPRAPSQPRAIPAAAIGFGVGVLGGIVGLILGTMRLPALVRWAGVSPQAAVGTNSAVGMVVGIGGLIGHLASGIDWAVFAVAAVPTVPGALLGARLTGRLDDQALLRVIAVILFLTGTVMLIEAVMG